ncbi:hypothetical protein [Arthrospiribacter ruber]|uniref:Uncharacterized protein n=1 Tax=Arthrospiribacter ruber TaxID=2487934 RepID=A0A951J0A5_9BACT|nr:hypothetical protein [Arthrospiribacter ruber]MBW3470450.1 hypothetical protein [Arthrospiribacter ruber]
MSVKNYPIRYVMILCFTFLSSLAYAVKGKVVFRISGCDYFIVETNIGYALLEWYGGNDPDKDDIIIGDFESYGMKDIYNNTTDSELRVWVEDYWLSWEDALEKLYENCD